VAAPRLPDKYAAKDCGLVSRSKDTSASVTRRSGVWSVARLEGARLISRGARNWDVGWCKGRSVSNVMSSREGDNDDMCDKVCGSCGRGATIIGCGAGSDDKGRRATSDTGAVACAKTVAACLRGTVDYGEMT
jgi:hypothetical protein